MAIYHLHAKLIQRSKGANAVASAAYRRAIKVFDQKEKRYWDYSRKENVIHCELLLPNVDHPWIKDLAELNLQQPNLATEKLWNLVEAVELRKDAQLARELEFALPIELEKEQAINLAREFIQDQFVMRGMIADWNVHWDEGNPHVHVMLTTRELTPDGFGNKVRAWNNRALLQECREQWAKYANFHLQLHQHTVFIDPRSYEAQGIDLVPTIHQGKAASDMESRGINTDIMREANVIRLENLTRISTQPTVLLKKLSLQSDTFTGQQLSQELGRYINDQGKFSIHDNNACLGSESLLNLDDIENQLALKPFLTPELIANIFSTIESYDSVFAEKQLAKALTPFTDNADLFAKAMVEIKACKELIYLGAGDDGRDRFTTRRMFDLENEIQEVADKMHERAHIKIASKKIISLLEKHQKNIGKGLTQEQLNAVQHILNPASISCIVGRAGTGKSFSLSAAKAVWEAQGMQVYGIALSGIAADGLAKEGIDSRTIESFRYAIEKNQLVLNT